jgi:hypothetical protein
LDEAERSVRRALELVNKATKDFSPYGGVGDGGKASPELGGRVKGLLEAITLARRQSRPFMMKEAWKGAVEKLSVEDELQVLAQISRYQKDQALVIAIGENLLRRHSDAAIRRVIFERVMINAITHGNMQQMLILFQRAQAEVGSEWMARFFKERVGSMMIAVLDSSAISSELLETILGFARAAVEADPQNEDYQVLEADVLMALGRVNPARVIYQSLLPQNSGSSHLKARLRLLNADAIVN